MGHGNRRRGVPLEGQMSTFTTGGGKDPVLGWGSSGLTPEQDPRFQA